MVRETYSEQETFELGKEIGEHAKGGEVFTLEGDLGVGKTVFTKGFAYGLGVRDDVVSPTFTIVQEYEDGRLPFYHFDVYRIGAVEEMDEIGYEDYIQGEGVCLIAVSYTHLDVYKRQVQVCSYLFTSQYNLRITYIPILQ